MRKPRPKQLGELLIEKEIITPEQLQQALQLQMQEGGLIGQILVKLKCATQEQIDECVYEQSITLGLENSLVEMGMLSPEQVELASEKGRESSLTQAVVDLGFLNEEDIVGALVTQYNFPFLELKNYTIEKNVVKLVPQELARKYCFIPIDKLGDILTVAAADPLNPVLLKTIKKETGLNVEFFVATFSEIKEAIAQYYS